MTCSDGRCIVVAEVAQAHDGSLGMAHAFIEAAARAGADAIKFQTHIAAAESTLREPWRIRFSRQDQTRFDYWRRMEFAEEQWVGLKQHADEKGLAFISSPFSQEAIALLMRVGVTAWKIPSGETGNIQMLEATARTRQPVILSTGMSSITEIDSAVETIRRWNDELTVLQCTTAYPCPPDRVGLNLIPTLRDRYRCRVGLSDHSGTIYAGLAAVALGARMLEVHLTFSREMFGPDVSSSLTTAELGQLVEGTRFIEAAANHPVDKDELAQLAQPLREAFGKSIVATTDLNAGTILAAHHLALKKPGTGLGPARLADIIGRRLACAVKRDDLVLEESLE